MRNLNKNYWGKNGLQPWEMKHRHVSLQIIELLAALIHSKEIGVSNVPSMQVKEVYRIIKIKCSTYSNYLVTSDEKARVYHSPT